MPLLDPTSQSPTFPPENLYQALGLPSPFPPSSSRSTNQRAQQPHLTTSQIKAAYRRTLLKYHPDKASQSLTNPASSASSLSSEASATQQSELQQAKNSSKPTIDTITLAREVLTDPRLRRLYDKHLLLSSRGSLQTWRQRQRAPETGPQTAAATGQEGDGYDYDDDYDGDQRGPTQGTETETIDLDDMSYNPSEGMWTRPCRCGEGGGFVLREEDLEAASCSSPSGGGEVVVGCAGCSLFVRVLFAVGDEDDGAEDDTQGEGDEEAAGDMGRTENQDEAVTEDEGARIHGQRLPVQDVGEGERHQVQSAARTGGRAVPV